MKKLRLIKVIIKIIKYPICVSETMCEVCEDADNNVIYVCVYINIISVI